LASRFQDSVQTRFGGGINTAKPANEIADDECVDILNKDFDKDDNLKDRLGNEDFCSALPISAAQRITSLFQLRLSSGSDYLIATHGSELRSITSSTAASIKGALTLPSDTYWQWVAFNDVAIGVNRATSGDNPVQWTGTGDATALAGTPPKGKYIEVWNNRVWIVDAANPNKLWFSRLGNGADWTHTTAGALEIGYNDGDTITGIKAHRKQLFVFKRNKIYNISTGTPNTDPNLWKVDLFASNIGCVSAYTIQPLLDDLIFLSDAGVISLAAVQQYGDFRQAIVSQNVVALKDVPKSIDTFASVVNAEESQYWLSVPSSTSGTANGQTFVLDYKRIAEGKIRWTRFGGLCAGSAFASVITSGRKRVFIGSSSNVIYRYGDASLYNDNGASYGKSVLTKQYDMGDVLLRKEWNHWALALEMLACPLALSVKYRLDGDESKSKTEGINFLCDGTTFSTNANGGSTGTGNDGVDALWDVATWDAVDANDDGTDDNSGLPFVAYTFGREGTNDREVYRRFSGDPGRKGQTVQFFISNAVVNQACIIKDLKLETKPLNRQRVSDV
jgi:hypothetical protein